MRDSLCYIGNIYYEPALKEMSEKLELEVEDIRTLIRQISRPSSKVTKDLDCILIKGYLKYYEELANLNIKEIETGFSAIDTYKLDNYSFIQNEVLQLKNKEDLIIVSNKNEDRTTASLLWSDLVQNENKSRRIYYLLPLIKSINTLYKELLDKNIESGIVHSQAEDFLSELQSDKDIKHLYESFKRSTKQLTLCTFERVIRSVFSYKDYEMLLAQFKNSIFIVDEVHYFDTDNTAKLLTILKFLKDKLNISICIMSSSMSEELKEVICSDLNINNIIIDEDSKSDLEKIPFDSDEYSKVSEGINKVISICRVATYKSY